ncbi:hypothetical protein [Clostridium botulinum]|uniref:Uncharacterized protein n=1 Tax=Clostridium botulinum TaxID=1491 RepID=A0A6B4JIH5_CLOBO|nr:hypothetical protein [Clostridium botulinum]EES47922.1 hypothetical protein CLO_0863 [Clostridium botulinum E1 str. 'BoNT E Beluga']MBY6760039.1 hypothetical protein [Clostridium botulinum]MBY6915599.1 hypothetical protein [Clostridium botulinum]MBY6918948.1 hypothetical protein [Clostridium botulinum]MBY6928997.1 hypothetical protein [Clostridium botulinum]
MNENWFALYLAVVGDKSLDAALGIMGIRPKRKYIKNSNFKLDDSSVKVIEFLKLEHTWDEIGEMCGVKGEFLRMKVRNYKKNTKELCRADLVGINLKNNSISL